MHSVENDASFTVIYPPLPHGVIGVIPDVVGGWNLPALPQPARGTG